MPESMTDTQALLERHHRNGERFAELMKQTAADRFTDEFWDAWERWIVSVYSEPQPIVMDLGTGPGTFLHMLADRYPGIRAIGVECASYMLDAMGELPANSEIVAEDLHDPHLPLADASVDAALASVVLHEMQQPVKTLFEVQRCLKPGGRFFILDWVRAPLSLYLEDKASELFRRETPVAELEDVFVHFVEHNRFSREDLGYLLGKTGFRVLESTPFKEGRFARVIAERL